MIKSISHHLLTSIFADVSQYPSFVIKFLLVLETEQLIPLFKIRDNSGQNKSLSAFVIDKNNQHLSVANILNCCFLKTNFVLFYGSHFQVLLGQKFGNQKVVTDSIETFLIFTQQGLILENDDIFQDLNQNKYQFIEWDCWRKMSICFDENEPKCSLTFFDRNDYFLEIKTINNSNSEVETIEQQLPLIFCYFVMKRFWKYVEKMSYDDFLLFNPKDFIPFDNEKLTYFTNNILKNINIREEDLSTLMTKMIEN
ncbi:hypothetical protein ACN4EE_08990 [Geminocystis sp. CENA526]|uniref:hypothetical protein n=1 Tax=Geminocystis sp. CENA526 TaxID=1355871 RepID=UPI003D6FD79E